MVFSEYIVLENAGSSVDPLGFLRPSAALADNLFKQFTVLSNHPAYHGFLCFLYLFLAQKGQRPGKGFSMEFRNLEAVWGVLNSTAKKSILNVTKYDELLKNKELTLGQAQKYAPLYARLNYGTLGHYSSPSAFWGLLNLKGTELTPLGQKLGAAWQKRNGQDFADVLQAWSGQDRILENSEFKTAVSQYHLEAEPSQEEVAAWREVINAYCIKSNTIRPLWVKPVPKTLMDLSVAEETYPGFYSGVQEHYREHPDLCRRVDLARRFELLAGGTQFLFEWEYVRRLDEGKETLSGYSEVQERIAQLLPEVAGQYLAIPESRDAGTLFKALPQTRGETGVADEILAHHERHQKSKGAGAFIRDKDVAVRDRVSLEDFSKLLEALNSNGEAWEQKISWHYRRDWHFHRAAQWLQYAGGAL